MWRYERALQERSIAASHDDRIYRNYVEQERAGIGRPAATWLTLRKRRHLFLTHQMHLMYAGESLVPRKLRSFIEFAALRLRKALADEHKKLELGILRSDDRAQATH